MINLKKIGLLVALLGVIGIKQSSAQVDYPGVKPGLARISALGNVTTLQNGVLSLSFQNSNNKLTMVKLNDIQGHEQLSLKGVPLFKVTLTNGEVINSDEFALIGKPKIVAIAADADQNVSLARKSAGKKYVADFDNAKLGLKVHWEASLRNNSNYVRQEFAYSAKDSVKVSAITLVSFPNSVSLKKEGTVDGSPLIHNQLFFAVEHPMSQISTDNGSTSVYLPRLNSITSTTPITISAAWGVTPKNQLRRGFLYYIERERASPYRQMLHYNSWFDLSWGNKKMEEVSSLDRIKMFTDSLTIKRHVRVNGYLFDDGWDDNTSLWQLNSGFPDGFTKLSAATKASNASLGVWVSPWGGYGKSKQQRIAYGKQQNPPFETNKNGFSLTGPIYYKRFKEVTTSFIKNYNVSMFKFDGVGAGNGASGASITYQQDIEALIKLINDLRDEKPGLYLSLTVGTWPSVYWLKYGDAIWRAGEDTGLAPGDGPKRQQWITYKDGQAFKNIVNRAPLFPLNAIMYHGICVAENGLPGKLEMDEKNIADEIWAFFGTGTGLQELYINPHDLTTNEWNYVRDAANWSIAHKKELTDVHWVGGDPLKGEVYGYAGWAQKKGTLSLRNPTGVEKTFTVNVKTAFDLPANETDNYRFFDAKTGSKTVVYSGKTFTVKLAPYQVQVMDAKAIL